MNLYMQFSFRAVTLATLIWLVPPMLAQSSDLSSVHPGHDRTTNQAPGDILPTEVVLLGALHGYHEKNPHYTLKILRDIIVSCKPQSILVELPETSHGKPTVKDGRLVEDYTKLNELRASQQAADELKIPIHPFDMDLLDDIREETRFWQRQREAGKQYAAFLETWKNDETLAELRSHRFFHGDMERSVVTFAEKGTPEIINSEAFDSAQRAKSRLSALFDKAVERVIQVHPQQTNVLRGLNFVGEEWQRRNECMAEKIEGYAKRYQSKRIVVVVGAEHRYLLRDLLRNRSALTCKEYWELLPQPIRPL